MARPTTRRRRDLPRRPQDRRSRDARAKYLEQICAGDQPLRERVEALLKVHEQEQAFLIQLADPPPTAEPRHSPSGPAPRSAATA